MASDTNMLYNNKHNIKTQYGGTK